MNSSRLNPPKGVELTGRSNRIEIIKKSPHIRSNNQVGQPCGHLHGKKDKLLKNL